VGIIIAIIIRTNTQPTAHTGGTMPETEREYDSYIIIHAGGHGGQDHTRSLQQYVGIVTCVRFPWRRDVGTVT
jgi:hypothetical protein